VNAAKIEGDSLNVAQGLGVASAITPRGNEVAAPATEAITHGAGVAVRTEYTGISDHPSTRVYAAPGGNSTFSFSGNESIADRIGMLKERRAAVGPMTKMTNKVIS
jgi:hypothetical protein